MSKTISIQRNFETIAWGALLIWWGFTEMFASLPEGARATGIGLILIGVNAARLTAGYSASRFSTTLGVLALIWGGLKLSGVFLSLPFELPIFGILLIVLGAIVLAPELTGRRNR